MTIVPPSQFKEAFLQAVATVNPQIITLWDVRRDYTALMLDTVFPSISTELAILVWNANYYYLDSVFYSERDSDHFGPGATYAKCISIAMEHEHDIAGTAVEMNKLQLFNAPLKVLITYAQTEQLRDIYLERYAKIVRGADIFGDFTTLRRTLVIFGSLIGGVVAWHFYTYESSGFRSL